MWGEPERECEREKREEEIGREDGELERIEERVMKEEKK